jgi:hypothetical protein
MASTVNGNPSRGGPYTNTTDATQTTAGVFSTVSNRAYKIVASVVGLRTDDFAEVGDYMLEAAFKNDAGTLTQIGSTRSLHTANESTAGWDATIDASGTDIRVLVTGAADTPITWLVDAKVIEVAKWIANQGLVGG